MKTKQNKSRKENHIIIEFAQLERTHQDHGAQSVALHRAQESRVTPCV